jgi:hypothetical protein
MSVVIKGIITASTPNAGVVTLTFTDESTGLGTVISRVLTIYDFNGNLLDTINMGSALTVNYNVTADGYFSFVETVSDNAGGPYVETVNYTSIAFYISVFAPAVAAIPTYCSDIYGRVNNLNNAEINKNAALDMTLFGQGVAAQALITRANFLLATPYYA